MEEQLQIRSTADVRSPLITVHVPKRFALEWQLVFGDLALELVPRFIQRVMRPNSRLSPIRLIRARCKIAGIGGHAALRLIGAAADLLDAKPSDHHIIPTSRGGNSEKSNLVNLPRGWHSGWHALVGNCTPAEVPLLFSRILIDGTGWSSNNILDEIIAVRTPVSEQPELLQQTG